MPCYEGIDPNHFVAGALEDPSPGTTYVEIEDSTVVDKGSTREIVFEVNFNPAHPTLQCSVNYQTVDGTAVAGTHYTSTSGTLDIPATEAQGTITVPILGGHGDFDNRKFTVVISSAVNCTIVTNTATGTIKYKTKPSSPKDPDESDGSEANKKSRIEWVSWPTGKAVFYQQFDRCASRGSCTAYSAAAMMSCMEWRKKGKIVRFNPDKLFVSAGGSQCTQAQCSAGSCPGFYTERVLAYAKSTGIQMLNYSSYRKLRKYSQIQVGTSFSANKAARKAELIRRIKRAVFDNGAVIIEGTWYSNWNTAGMNSANGYIMPIPGSGSITAGHAYVIIGWKKINNRDVFVIQNSSGNTWAKNGRAFLPLAYINVDSWLPSMGHPWFRFYRVVYGG